MTRAIPTAALAVAAVLLTLLVPTAGLADPQPAPGTPDVPRLAGVDRYATSVAIARASHGDRPEGERPAAAVLARGDAFADALAGAPLAHHLDAPVLLTRPDGLPDVVRDGLRDLLTPGATVHVLGGEVAVGPAVVADLRADGFEVVRHAGPTRYATAAAIADALPASDVAYVASGVEPADALAAAPVAARRGAPVLLTDPATLPAATADALRGVAEAVVVGGPVAVSAEVADRLARDHALTRVAGPDRFATAVAVARHAPEPASGVSLASGRSWPDALAGAAHAAATGSVLLLSDTDRLTWPTAAELTRRASSPVRVYGGPVAVAAVVEEDVHLARTSDPGAPVPSTISPGRAVVGPTEVRIGWSSTLAAADVQVDPSGDAAPRRDGSLLVVPVPGADADTLHVAVRGTVEDDDGRVRRFREPVTVVAPPRDTTSPEGFRVAGGVGPVVGTSGPVVRWTAEVEPATGRPVDDVLPVVAAALEDAGRGWTARGERRLQRVDDPAVADVRVVLATPDTVDRYCARRGLDTAGIFSCWDGQRAMLNLYRWDRGASDFDDLGTYRTYLVNHEVGHGLEYGHVDCPASGVLAPVMMQQTKTTGSCRPNGWPYP